VVIPTTLEGHGQGLQCCHIFWGIALIVLAEAFEGKGCEGYYEIEYSHGRAFEGVVDLDSSINSIADRFVAGNRISDV
jgi:hypothetical protein